jgi:glycosyltransferase involved in cell wall biosynthesis
MYWRKPCVVTDVGDCGRVVEHGRTGLVVPPQDPDALAGALLDLLDDPQKALQMGRLGRTRLEDHYRIERYVGDWERLLLWI